MKIEDIKKILYLLDEEDLISIRKMLLAEIAYDELKKNKRMTIQKTFEKYITNVLNPGYSAANIYGEVDGLFTFTNGASLYQLNQPLFISEFITNKQKRGSRWEHRSRPAAEGELEKYISFVNKLFGDNKKPANYCEEDKTSTSKVILVKSLDEINYAYFSSEEINYLKKFIGKDSKIYLSNKKPLLYSESDKGRGYVLCMKKC